MLEKIPKMAAFLVIASWLLAAILTLIDPGPHGYAALFGLMIMLYLTPALTIIGLMFGVLCIVREGSISQKNLFSVLVNGVFLTLIALLFYSF